VAEPAGEFDEAVNCFGAGVAEEDSAGDADAFFDDELGQIGLGSDLVEIRAMGEFEGLAVEGLGEGAMAVPEGAGGDARAEIEVSFSVLVPEP